MERYIVFIANIKHSDVTVNCFLFEIKDGQKQPVENGCFYNLPEESPLRLNKAVMEIAKNGAESLSKKDQEHSKQNETKTTLITEEDKGIPRGTGMCGTQSNYDKNRKVTADKTACESKGIVDSNRRENNCKDSNDSNDDKSSKNVSSPNNDTIANNDIVNSDNNRASTITAISNLINIRNKGNKNRSSIAVNQNVSVNKNDNHVNLPNVKNTQETVPQCDNTITNQPKSHEEESVVSECDERSNPLCNNSPSDIIRLSLLCSCCLCSCCNRCNHVTREVATGFPNYGDPKITYKTII